MFATDAWHIIDIDVDIPVNVHAHSFQPIDRIFGVFLSLSLSLPTYRCLSAEIAASGVNRSDGFFLSLIVPSKLIFYEHFVQFLLIYLHFLNDLLAFCSSFASIVPFTETNVNAVCIRMTIKIDWNVYLCVHMRNKTHTHTPQREERKKHLHFFFYLRSSEWRKMKFHTVVCIAQHTGSQWLSLYVPYILHSVLYFLPANTNAKRIKYFDFSVL